MNLRERGERALIRRKKKADGRLVTYARNPGKPNENSITLTAWPGSSPFTQNIEDPGAVVVFNEHDECFEAADLVFGGVQVVPEEGDRITVVIAGQEVMFKVMPIAGEPCWKYSDFGRSMIRVHTKPRAAT